MRRSAGLILVAGFLLLVAGLTGPWGRVAAEAPSSGRSECDDPDDLRQGRLPLDLNSDSILADLVAHGERSRAMPLARDGQISVLVLAQEGRTRDVERRLVCWGGELAVVEPAVGYLRGHIPLTRWPALRALSTVAAAQIDGLTWLPGWSQDERLMLAKSLRASATRLAPAMRRDDPTERPAVPSVAGVVGLERLRQQHPTFDGRGVTIAVVEGATRLGVYHPALRTGLTLDGRRVPKIADVLPLAPGQHSLLRSAVDPETGIVENVETLDVSEPIAWVRGLPYRLPYAGPVHIGQVRIGGALYAVAWQPATTATWVDVNGNGDFTDDPCLYDIRRPEATDALLVTPWPANYYTLHERDRIRILPITDPHATMTASVAAGADVPGNLAVGLAPGARLVLVDGMDTAHTYFEAFIRAAQHPDVDMLFSSNPQKEWPASSGSLAGQLFDRIATVYNKPVFKAAGNDYGADNAEHVGRAHLSVGAYVDPASLAAYYGFAEVTEETVWSYSSRGPLLDGSLGVGVLAPATMVKAGLCDSATRHARLSLSSCYGVSGGTSSAAPALAGVAASLLSGARQQGLIVTATELVGALRSTARQLPTARPIDQGNGLIQADKAWRALVSSAQPTDITVEAPVNHVLEDYRGTNTMGVGLFEREGWTVGQRGTRRLRLKRTSGPAMPIAYALRWIGNDGTYSARSRIVLPLERWTELPVDLHVRSFGWHSATLQLLASDREERVVTEIPFTVLAAEELPKQGRALSWLDRGHRASRFEHAIGVHREVDALIATVELSENAAVRFFEPAGWLYARHQDQFMSVSLKAGTHRLEIPNPAQGTWSLVVAPVTEAGAPLEFTSRVSVSAIERPRVVVARRAEVVPRTVTVTLAGEAPGELGARVGESVTTWHRLEANDMPLVLPVDVPPAAESLLLRVRTQERGQEREGTVHAYLYRCTTGTCVRVDSAVPAASVRAMQIDAPQPGRWILVVTPGPVLASSDTVTVERVIAHPGAGTVVVDAQPPQRQQDERSPVSLRASYGNIAHGAMPVLLVSRRTLASKSDSSVGTRPSTAVRDRLMPIATVIPLASEQGAAPTGTGNQASLSRQR